MFYYLSFLRPPPSQVSLSQPIPITPQIANDLRTEHYNGEQDIFYSWWQVSTTPAHTKPTKLTRWRQATAYKEMSVPVPASVRDGQAWRLMLTCSSSFESAAYEIPLGDHHLGSLPFPVLSMPIVFSSRKPKGAASKQEKIERIYTFSVPRAHGSEETAGLTRSGPTKAAIEVIEQTSFDLDKKIWDSGIGLSSWLVNLASEESQDLEISAPNLDESLKLRSYLVSGLRGALFADEPRRVLELGAGTGIVALTITALRVALLPARGLSYSHIITTDLETAMPLLKHNIDSNVKLFPEESGALPRAMVLDWDDEEIPKDIKGIADQSGHLDAIVMADVTYNTSSFPSLIRTLCKLVRLCQKPPLILLGYKERDTAERSLWNLAQEVNIHFTLIDEIPGLGGAPIEIWIGRVTEG